MNARSDSVVSAYKDTIMKYYGGDSIGRALNQFFDGYSSECPRNCLDIMTRGQGYGYTHILLLVIGNYSIQDFTVLDGLRCCCRPGGKNNVA